MIRLPSSEKKLFFEAAFWVLTAKALIILTPMSFYYKFLLGEVTEEEREVFLDADEIKKINKVSLAIGRAGKVIPIRRKCYPKAVAAKKMLNRLGIESTLYLGACMKEGKLIGAHAWISSGPLVVTGRSGKNSKYHVVSMFV